jgi:tetratricopeptide (TPR) repeat protein
MLLGGCAAFQDDAVEDVVERRAINAYREMVAATTLQLHGQHHEAVAIYRELLAREPESPLLRVRLAHSLLELGAQREAAHYLAEAWPLAEELLRADMMELVRTSGSRWLLQALAEAMHDELADRAQHVSPTTLVWAQICGLALLESDPEHVEFAAALVAMACARSAVLEPIVETLRGWLAQPELGWAIESLVLRLMARERVPQLLDLLGTLRLAQGEWEQALGLWEEALHRAESRVLRSRYEALKRAL